MDQFLNDDILDLSIVKPPYHSPNTDSKSHVQFIKTIMEKITKLTKVGGICCLILSEDMTDKGMDITEMQALLEIQNDPQISSKWIFPEKIIWVKSSQKATESLFPIEEGTLVSFDLTPFSTIWILVRVQNENDSSNFDISNRINELKISEVKKQEMFDSMWFIPQKSETGYKDHIPKELILRLLMIFSKENNLVLDPFSGNGITAVACKTLSRHFICIDNNESNNSISKTRIKNLI